MAVISVSLPSDGDNIEAANYNTPITTIVNEINGALDNSNIAAAAAIAGSKLASGGVGATQIADGGVTNAKLATGAGQPGGAWTSFTPTLSGRFDDGDWTKTCSYTQIGRTVFFRINLIASAAAPMGGGVANAIFTLPVTAATIPGTDGRQILGSAYLADDNGSFLNATVTYGSTTTGVLYSWSSSQVLTAITSTAPFTWTTSDEISIFGSYEAAA